jgi:hypothetical protein
MASQKELKEKNIYEKLVIITSCGSITRDLYKTTNNAWQAIRKLTPFRQKGFLQTSCIYYNNFNNYH